MSACVVMARTRVLNSTYRRIQSYAYCVRQPCGLRSSQRIHVDLIATRVKRRQSSQGIATIRLRHLLINDVGWHVFVICHVRSNRVRRNSRNCCQCRRHLIVIRHVDIFTKLREHIKCCSTFIESTFNTATILNV